jgi:cytochrome c
LTFVLNAAAGLPSVRKGRLAAVFLFVAVAFLSSLPGFANDLPDTLKGHGGPIKSISVSADGTRALTASFDYSIIYWDISGAEARILHRLIGHDGAVNDAAFVPGSNQAVSVSDDGSLGIWDLASGKLITRIMAENYKVLNVAVSDDAAKAAAARWDGTAKLYDLGKQAEIATLKGHKGNVNAVVFSSDGSKLYTAAYDGQIIEWDAATGAQIRPIYNHGWGINSIARIDDNRLLFGALDGTVAIAGISEADVLTTLTARERPIQSVKVSDDGKLMAYADGEGVIEVFRTDTGEKIAGAPVAFGPVWDFDFVPGKNQIYHVGLDDFAMRWQVAPLELARIQSEIPRRFQMENSDDPGELEFRRKCSVCHTLTPDDKNRAGPTLYEVFGRKAGGLPDYPYSPALKKADIIWNEKTIAELFDHGPDVVVPGTKMPIQRLKSVERRDALIRFLKKATTSID